MTEPRSGKPLRFGVNYVPSRTWWHCWQDWRPDEIAADLQAIAKLGLDHIRIHCLWPNFQPNAAWVSPVAVGRLDELLGLADAAGLDVCVCVLDGWLSGFAFFPTWKKPTPWAGGKNMFTDPDMIAAEKLLFTRLAERIGEHPRFLGFDLGNELGVLMTGDDKVNPAQADAWQADMLDHCAAVAPGRLHVNGVDHTHWFFDRGFTRPALARSGAATSVHAWTEFTGALARYGARGTGSVHIAEYCIELAKAYHDAPGRPVWLQEFGASAQWMPAEQIPDFLETTVRNAAACEDLWGVTCWCSHDLDPGLVGFHPLEYDLGLIDRRNHVKPSGERFAALVRQLRETPPAPVLREVGLVLPDSAFAGSTLDGAWRFASAFMSLIGNGIRPAIVCQARAADAGHLAARGITRLVTPTG